MKIYPINHFKRPKGKLIDGAPQKPPQFHIIDSDICIWSEQGKQRLLFRIVIFNIGIAITL